MKPEVLDRELRHRGIRRPIVSAARALGVHESTVWKWLNRKHPIPDWVQIALRSIERRGR